MIYGGRRQGKSLRSAHHRAFLTSTKLAENENKKFTIIYTEHENVDVLKALIQLYLCTKYGYHARNASQLVEENVIFQLDGSAKKRDNIILFKDEATL